MRSTRKLSCAIPLMLIAGLAAACGSGDLDTQTAGGLHVIRFDGGTPGMGNAALLTGIVRDGGGCLTVEDPATGGTYAPIFPSSMASPVPDSLGAGDEVTLRGGVVDVPVEDSTIPKECAGQATFWLVVDGP